MNKDDDWGLIGFIVSSKYRRRVVEYLMKGVATPKQIATGTNIRINHISNVLSALSKKEIVICMNPEAKMGRFYKLTEKGEIVFNVLQKITRDLD